MRWCIQDVFRITTRFELYLSNVIALVEVKLRSKHFSSILERKGSYIDMLFELDLKQGFQYWRNSCCLEEDREKIGL